MLIKIINKTVPDIVWEVQITQLYEPIINIIFKEKSHQNNDFVQYEE